MTVDDIQDVRDAIINTTQGPNTVSTYNTGRRLTSRASFRNGYGLARADRAVVREETTILGVGTAVGAAAGLGGLFFALARPETPDSA